MFTTGWAAARRRSACRTADVLALKAHNLDATTSVRAPNFGDPTPSSIANSARHRRSPKGRARSDLRLLENGVVGITYFILCRSSRDCLKNSIRSASVGRERCCNCRKCPHLATGKTRSVT